MLNFPARLSSLISVFLFAGVVILTGGCGLLGVTKQPEPTVFATLSFAPQSEPFGVAFDKNSVFVSDGLNGQIIETRLNDIGEPMTVVKGLATPSQITFDDAGNLLIADSGSHSVKRFFRDSKKLETIAGTDLKSGFADGDGRTSARFRAPVGIAFGDGRIYVADTYNDRIRVIDAAGNVSTLAGSKRGYRDGRGSDALFNTPSGLAFAAGKLYIADTGNRRIRVIDVTSGEVGTIAGNGEAEHVDGAPNTASFTSPVAVAVAGGGSLLIADGHSVRKFVPAQPGDEKGKNVAVEARVETFAGAERRGFADGALADTRFNRVAGIAVEFGTDGGLVFVADSENGLLRVASAEGFGIGNPPTTKQVAEPKTVEEFRRQAPARWPYDPPENRREIAGTLGEIRGEMKPDTDQVWFHNGLDVVGGYGEKSRFVRDEKVLRLLSAENFGTSRELVRLPTLGYIHIRLGRDQNDQILGDERFIFERDETGKLFDVRIPRGAAFKAGEVIGTLNAMNHTHLIAGRSGHEWNALAALELPGVSDKIAPVIEETTFYDENWSELETGKSPARKKLSKKTRIVVRAYDRMDGNAERRRLGVYQLGYQLLKTDGSAMSERQTTIKFDRLPEPDAVFLVYANGSKSGATGETIFRYIVTNRVFGETAQEDFLDPAKFTPGDYLIRVFAADFFGNEVTKDIPVSIG